MIHKYGLANYGRHVQISAKIVSTAQTSRSSVVQTSSRNRSNIKVMPIPVAQNNRQSCESQPT